MVGVEWRSYFVVGQHNERTAARRLDDDGQEFGIHSAECRVPTAFRDANVVVALVAFNGRAVNVSKFRTSHDAERHDARGLSVSELDMEKLQKSAHSTCR